MRLMVRPTGVLVEDGKLLLLKQDVTKARQWSLPGGQLEPDETIETCLVREFKEETGVEVSVKELLYLCDRIYVDDHVVHITFLVDRLGDKFKTSSWTHEDIHAKSLSNITREISMVPIDNLTDYGFSPKFSQLVKADFPERGSYQGDFNTFFGEL